MISFADPSVNFGLQIGIPTASDDVEHLKSKTELNNLDTIGAQKTKKGTDPFSLQLNTSKTKEIENTLENKTSTEKNLTTTDLNGEAQTAEVIALDTFRKK